jgi:hypothetical protein
MSGIPIGFQPGRLLRPDMESRDEHENIKRDF